MRVFVTGASARSKTSASTGSRRWLILGTVGLAQLMVVLDATIVNIALVSLITLHLSGAVISCGAGPADGHRPVPRASGLVAGRSISRDVFLAASLRAARLVINADLSNNS